MSENVYENKNSLKLKELPRTWIATIGIKISTTKLET